MKRPLCK